MLTWALIYNSWRSLSSYVRERNRLKSRLLGTHTLIDRIDTLCVILSDVNRASLILFGIHVTYALRNTSCKSKSSYVCLVLLDKCWSHTILLINWVHCMCYWQMSKKHHSSRRGSCQMCMEHQVYVNKWMKQPSKHSHSSIKFNSWSLY